MKLKEVPKAEITPGLKEEDGHVSPPPIFDLDAEVRSRFIAEGLEDDFSLKPDALKLAFSLSIYNYETLGSNSKDGLKRLLNNLSILEGKEKAAFHAVSLLPTIGIEVETAIKLSARYTEKSYGRFFKQIGMPENKVNRAESAYAFWEFSPPPSFSAEVQCRILSELIKGGFIPFLTESKDPLEIEKYLDEKLISLHVNLGIPKKVDISRVGNKFTGKEDIEIYSSCFAFAFSSSERLLRRHSDIYYTTKICDTGWEKTEAYKLGFFRRLELKALEVLDSKVYRLLKEAQLIGGALFEYLSGNNNQFSEVWEKMKTELENIYREYEIDPDILRYKQKSGFREIAENEEIKLRLRAIITKKALEISSLRNPSSQTPLT